MAVHPIMISPVAPLTLLQQSTQVAAWTEQATEGLRSVNLSAGTAEGVTRGGSVTLTVPLDSRREPQALGTGIGRSSGTGQVHTTYGRSEPIRRDSLKRREALLKGKEGSRQRRRWENGTSLPDR